MKFQRSHIRYEPREVSTRRLAAAKRKLARQADALPLFAEQIRASQPTPEEQVRKADAAWKRVVEMDRRADAERWLKGRRLLRALPAERRAELLAEWNAKKCPAAPHYFLDFLWQRGVGR